MEPERKIEKWLKAYAKKRRTQAGEPFNLHPATRQLLQSEVARDKPKPEDDDESVSLWEVIRQQWALLLSFAVCIFLLGIILLPVAYHSKRRAELATMSGAREMASNANAPAVSGNATPAASLDEKKDMTLARNDLSDRESNRGSKEEDRKALVDRDTVYATNGAPSPTVAMTVTPSAAPGVSHSIGVTPLEVPPGSSPLTPTTPPLVAASAPGGNFSAGKLAEQPTALPAPAAAPPVETPSLAQNAATFSSQLKSDSEMGPAASRLGELQNVFKNSSEPSQTGPVLSNFQVQQNGNAIRLVDQDGSVYDGWLQLENQTVEKIQGQSGLNADTRLLQNSVTVAAGLPSQQIAAAQDALQIAQTYFFHVYGTNRTTRQTVSFTANLGANLVATNGSNQTFGLTDKPANSGVGGFGGVGGGGGGGGGGGEVAAGGGFDRLKSEATNQVQQLPWANLRITGTAVVNQTNRVPVNAAPVAPAKN